MELADGIQIWIVAANISNYQSRTEGKGWSSSLVIGLRADSWSALKTWRVTKLLAMIGNGADRLERF